MGENKNSNRSFAWKAYTQYTRAYLIHAGPVHYFQQVVEGVVQSVGSEGCTGVVQ